MCSASVLSSCQLVCHFLSPLLVMLLSYSLFKVISSQSSMVKGKFYLGLLSLHN